MADEYMCRCMEVRKVEPGLVASVTVIQITEAVSLCIELHNCCLGLMSFTSCRFWRNRQSQREME